MRIYALSPETLRAILRRTIWRFQGIVTLSFVLLGLYLALFARPIHLPTALPVVGVVAVAYFLVIFLHYRQLVRLLYSVRVELDGSGILYREAHQEPKRISRADIARVQERKDGFWIESVDPDLSLFIPFGLARDGDVQVRNDLSSWTIIELRTETGLGRGSLLRLTGLALALLLLLLANSLWLLIPAGIALFVAGALLEQRAMMRHETHLGSHRMYSMAFSFLIFVVVMKSCLVWMAMAFSR